MMMDTSYRIIPRSKHSFDVEMVKPSGHKKTVPGFVSEHEANAWIVQAKRMIRAAGPWTPLIPRKPNTATMAEAQPAPPLPQIEQPPAQDTRNGVAIRRARGRMTRVRSAAKS
jgi:hypothetical protein